MGQDVAVCQDAGVENQPTVYVCFERKGVYYLEELPWPVDTELRLRTFRSWWESKVSYIERLIQQWIWCKRLIVAVGEIPVVSSLRDIPTGFLLTMARHSQEAPHVWGSPGSIDIKIFRKAKCSRTPSSTQ
jgi:hypothetical protein